MYTWSGRTGAMSPEGRKNKRVADIQVMDGRQTAQSERSGEENRCSNRVTTVPARLGPNGSRDTGLQF